MDKKKAVAIVFTLIVIGGGILGAAAFKKFKQKAGPDPAFSPTEKKANNQMGGPVTAGNQLTKETIKSKIIFSSAKDNRSLNILNKKRLPASGISIRAIIKPGKNPLNVFKDSDIQKKGIQLKTNSLLKKSNWLYPVNKITIDKKNKQAVLEIAMINIGLKPFVLKPQEVLATVEFSPQAQPQQITLEFDPAKTQALGKNGEKIQLTLEDGVYEIK